MKSLSIIAWLGFWALVLAGHILFAVVCAIVLTIANSVYDTFKRHKERKAIYEMLKPGAGISFND